MRANSPKLLLGIIFSAALAIAHADIIPTLSSVVPVGSNFQWNYSVNVTVDQQVEQGDYFTIFDFGSIIVGSNTQPADWIFSSSLLGVTPSTVLPQDDPNVFNLTWTYAGTTPIPGQAFLGIFAALSTMDQLRADNFASRATSTSGPFAGTKIDNIGTVGVPVPEMSALAPIIGVCGLGMIGFVSSAIRRRRQS